MKKIAILGSTGSIGTQALEVIQKNKDKFQVEVLTAQNSVELLAQQARKFNPNIVVIGNEDKYEALSNLLEDLPIKVYAGKDAMAQVVESSEINIVLTAIVGYAGLIPTINAIKKGKKIAIANKETLVVAGDIITELAIKHKVDIIPVDSEHSAIFQCLAGEIHNPIEKIILTASGGPFRGKDKNFLREVTKAEALKHPNWDMGAKITIDSATMMNKGLEAIEAKWLFGLIPEQIEVIVHAQSIIHSMVQFQDGSIKAQMGLPDMKLPIQYALAFPDRIQSDFPRFDFINYPNLTFEKPDTEVFKCLKLAYDVMEKGGNYPCALNASNEIAVDAFLQDKIGFLEIPQIIESTLEKTSYLAKPNLDDYIATDVESRLIANKIINDRI